MSLTWAFGTLSCATDINIKTLILNTSQTHLPLSHALESLGRGAEDKLHKQQCLEASAKFHLILILSELDVYLGAVPTGNFVHNPFPRFNWYRHVPGF